MRGVGTGGPPGRHRLGQGAADRGTAGAECALALAQQNPEGEPDGGAVLYLPALRADLAAAEHLLSQISTAPWDEILRRSAPFATSGWGAVRGYGGLPHGAGEGPAELLKKRWRACGRTCSCAARRNLRWTGRRRALVRPLARAERDFGDRFFAAKQEERPWSSAMWSTLPCAFADPEGEPTELARQVSGSFLP